MVVDEVVVADRPIVEVETEESAVDVDAGFFRWATQADTVGVSNADVSSATTSRRCTTHHRSQADMLETVPPIGETQGMPRRITAPTGSTLSCANWQIEAPYRMLQNNLDPDVAERPDDLVVYGGTGRAARSC